MCSVGSSPGVPIVAAETPGNPTNLCTGLHDGRHGKVEFGTRESAGKVAATGHSHKKV